jgi:restriction system protein
MSPTLAALADGRPQTRSQLREVVAPTAGVFGEDLLEMLPSGKATVFGSRVGWALTYVSQAGLITRPKRGVYVISDRGRQVLANTPQTGGQQGSATVPRVFGI